MKQNDFAAFVMTYERPETLLKTISRLQSQTFPPKLILIVDNSESHTTETAIKELPHFGVEYLRVGFNAGPAGAASLGLVRLTQIGFKWIYWGDDDNPPGDNGVFETLFLKIHELQIRNISIGVIGGKGAYFNEFTGRLRSLSNSELSKDKIVEVDAVPGGHTMLVNAEVVKKGVLPTKKLFFGFEEFDFCLKIKKKNYKIFVDAESWLQIRHKLNKTGKDYQWKSSNFGNLNNIKRDYYSSRNLLNIFYKNNMVCPFIILMFKVWGKALFGFKFGWKYGKMSFKAQIDAFFHFLTGKYGPLK